jgi:hypothetical protein
MDVNEREFRTKQEIVGAMRSEYDIVQATELGQRP